MATKKTTEPIGSSTLNIGVDVEKWNKEKED